MVIIGVYSQSSTLLTFSNNGIISRVFFFTLDLFSKLINMQVFLNWSAKSIELFQLRSKYFCATLKLD